LKECSINLKVFKNGQETEAVSQKLTCIKILTLNITLTINWFLRLPWNLLLV